MPAQGKALPHGARLAAGHARGHRAPGYNAELARVAFAHWIALAALVVATIGDYARRGYGGA